jgi:hypothetical protein
VNVTASNARSPVAVMAAPSDFHPGVLSPVSRASLRVAAVIGTVMAPAWNTRVAFLARSMTRADSGVGTRWPPAVAVPSLMARSCSAPSQLPVAMPFSQRSNDGGRSSAGGSNMLRCWHQS